MAAGNPFYDTWVNRLTLDGLLRTDDLDHPHATAVSLLNGGAIDSAAGAAIGFTTPALKPRRYLAAPLRLILTLTNLNGMAYRIDFGEAKLRTAVRSTCTRAMSITPTMRGSRWSIRARASTTRGRTSRCWASVVRGWRRR